jgi:hypothetical protein
MASCTPNRRTASSRNLSLLGSPCFQWDCGLLLSIATQMNVCLLSPLSLAQFLAAPLVDPVGRFVTT